MQVFIVGSPLETARALDKRRLNKQIIECKQILDALDGAKAWSNHPCVLQYRGHKEWLRLYKRFLESYVEYMEFGTDMAKDNIRVYGHTCFLMTPPFHTEEYFDQMKRRLYTKMPEHYKQWEHLGESDVNWYFVDGEWRYYRNGKRIEL